VYLSKEVAMRTALAAIAVASLAVAAPISAAQASNVMIRVDTADFGFRIGTPVVPYPRYAPPVYVPAPVYAPPPVVYLPPRVVVPVVYPVVQPYPYRPVYRHWKHGRHYDARFRGYRRDWD
jgi:hypothetical protein